MENVSNRMSILINDTWVDLTDEYGMILMDGYEMGAPPIKTYTVDIPGRSGILDLSDTITGGPIYENREHSFSFAVLNPMDGDEAFKTRLMTDIHGRYFTYKVTMDPEYSYAGRFVISGIERSYFLEGVLLKIDISISVEPFKSKGLKKIEIYEEGWKKIVIDNIRYPTRLLINNPKEGSEVVYENKTYKMSIGINELPGLVLREGVNELWVNLGRYIRPTWLELSAYTYSDLENKIMCDIYSMGTSEYPKVIDPLVISYEWREL